MMKHVMMLIASLISCAFISARSYYGTPYTFSQPDGDSVSVRLYGDDCYINAESNDGYTLIQDPDDGYICYAMVSSDSTDYASSGIRYRGGDAPKALSMIVPPHVRISSDALAKKIEAAKKTLGIQEKAAQPELRAATVIPDTIYAVTVLIDFPDCQFPWTVAELDSFLNGNNGSICDNVRSIKDYFRWISNGKLTYINYVPKTPYRAPQPKTYYAPTDATDYTFDLLEPVVTDAVNSYTKSKDGFDMTDLTMKGSVYYAINIFYAGACPNKWATGLWAHQGAMKLRVNKDPRHSSNSWQYYQLSHCSSSLNMSSFVHESFHLLLDAPDFYPFDSHNDNTAQKFNVADEFSLKNTKNPPLPNPYILDAAGWLDNKIVLNDLEKGTKVNLEYGPGNVAVYYGNVDGDPMKERFYIEVRSFYYRSGWEIDDPGIYIWHVNESGDNRYSTSPDLLDCRPASSSNPFWSSSSPSAVFSDDSEPNAKWNNGQRSGLYLCNFSDAALKMSFCYGGGCVDEDEDEEEVQTGGITWDHPGGQPGDESGDETGDQPVFDKLGLTNRDSLPNGMAGQEYYAKLNAVGGDGKYSIVWKAGLPAGLSLNDDLEIVGVPEKAGSKMLKLLVCDGTGAQTEVWLKLTIEEVTSADDAMEANDRVALYSLNDEFVIASTRENTKCTVYTSNGIKIDDFLLANGEMRTFGAKYPSGVYIVDVDGKRIKIIKY